MGGGAASVFPVHACAYSRALAERSPGFAMQVFDPPDGDGDGAADAFPEDPYGELEERSGCPGLTQRFPDRVLVMTARGCFMNCRHCTRRWLLSKSEIVDTPQRLAACVEYVKARPLVRDVLLSGGDILTLDDARVAAFVDAFASLAQIDIVRLCTRAVCTNPARVTESLARTLGASGKVWVNTQFNCADEVTPQARRAADVLSREGIPMSCQSVLLKGVNDTPEKMLALLRALSAARIRPYYVFMCDPVKGTERFRVPLGKALEIERFCAENIGGLALPRFVADLPGSKRKMPISELAAAGR